MEQYKPINGFSDYQISNFGNVLSNNNYNRQGSKKLSPYLNKGRGYLYISLQTEEGRKNCILHRLVAQAFIPNPDNKPHVNHIDCNKTNNRANNLEWVTAKENAQHAIANDLVNPTRGEMSGMSKLTEEKVIDILSIKDKSYNQIAKDFGVKYSTIAHIKRGSRWAHVKRP